MNIIELPRTVLRVEYRLARLPLALVEQRIVSRLPEETPIRLIFERSLGVLDAAVGKALGDQALRRKGAALAERSDARGRAAALRTSATAERKAADDFLQAELSEAADRQSEALAERAAAVDDARTSEEQRKRDAEQAARKHTAAAKQQAADIATRRKESVDAAKNDALDRVRSTQQKVAKNVASTLQDAQAKRAAADAARSQADRVEELAAAEKQKRQEERAAAKS